MDEGIVRVFQGGEIEVSRNHIIGKKIYKYDTAGSTNDLAFLNALKGEKEGSVFWARGQTKGRGRLGRHWISHKDKGLYFSVILRPDIQLKEAPKITLLGALAMCQALRKFSGQPFLIKWPNDLVIEDKKIGGILTEMDAEINKVRFIIIGIGLNTNLTQGELPIKEAVSLRILLKKEIPPEGLLSACLKELDGYYYQFQKEGFSGIIKEIRNFSSLWGKQVKVNGVDAGTAIDFDEEGALVARQASGVRKHIFAGDVELLRSGL